MDTFNGAIWEIIQVIRPLYSTEKQIKMLRKQFCGALRGSGVVSRPLTRKIANNWRCIAYAIKNEVPKDDFVMTNYRRMQKQDSNNSDSGDTESESSSFENILSDPLINIPDITSYPMDVSVFLDDSGETSDVVASGEQPSQAPKKNKKKKRRLSSGCRNNSKFVHVLDNDVCVCRRCDLTAIFRKSSSC